MLFNPFHSSHYWDKYAHMFTREGRNRIVTEIWSIRMQATENVDELRSNVIVHELCILSLSTARAECIVPLYVKY
jgi:hypothetical protein